MNKEYDAYFIYNSTDGRMVAHLIEELEKLGVRFRETPEQKFRLQLRTLLENHFSLDELRTLCTDLNIKYYELKGGSNATLSDTAREMILYSDNSGQLYELVKLAKAERPDTPWKNIDISQLNVTYQYKLNSEQIKTIYDTTRMAVYLMGRDDQSTSKLGNLVELAKTNMAIAIVFLPGAPQNVNLPNSINKAAQVDLRRGINAEGIGKLHQIIMEVDVVVGAIQALVSAVTQNAVEISETSMIDSWGIASVKNRISTLSELVAQDATEKAHIASNTYPHSVLTKFVPLIIDLTWKRGYASALRRLLNIPEYIKRLGDFNCQEVLPPCPVMEGIVSASQDGTDQILVNLDGQPAVIVCNLDSKDLQVVLEAINSYGRLGVPRIGGLSLLQRIEDIPIHNSAETQNPLATALYRNKEALIPLIARYGMPGDNYLLPEDEGFIREKRTLPPQAMLDSKPVIRQSTILSSPSSDARMTEKVFLAIQAVKTGNSKKLNPKEQLAEIMKSDPNVEKYLRALFGDKVDTDPQSVWEAISKKDSSKS